MPDYCPISGLVAPNGYHYNGIKRIKEGDDLDYFEIEQAMKDIRERKELIHQFWQTGRLDRDKTIKKIVELRVSDQTVMTLEHLQMSSSPAPRILLERATDAELVEQLKVQVAALEAKLGEIG